MHGVAAVGSADIVSERTLNVDMLSATADVDRAATRRKVLAVPTPADARRDWITIDAVTNRTAAAAAGNSHGDSWGDSWGRNLARPTSPCARIGRLEWPAFSASLALP